MTGADGSFIYKINNWSDSIEFSHAGFEKLVVGLHKGQSSAMNFKLKEHVALLNDIIIKVSAIDKQPGKRCMQKVIANKSHNDPDRFKSYSYGQYSRHEVGISNIDTLLKGNKGLKNLTINIYRSTGAANAKSTILPIYFSKIISNKYHNFLPAVNKENILAKKALGLQTDNMLRKLHKFNFSFNIYND